MQSSLVMFKADGERKEFPLNKSEVVVGRKNTCDLRIPLSSVSRQHFKVVQEDDKLMLRDLGSSNGTFYNDERVLEAALEAGDQIRVGPVTFVVVIDGKPQDIEPVATVVSEKQAAATAGGEADVEAKPEPAKPKAIETGHDMPAKVEEEEHSPTVTIDDDDEDPIAALEALAMADDEGDENDDSFAIPFLEDEDEDEGEDKK